MKYRETYFDILPQQTVHAAAADERVRKTFGILRKQILVPTAVSCEGTQRRLHSDCDPTCPLLEAAGSFYLLLSICHKAKVRKLK